jgi:hypothetical protein
VILVLSSSGDGPRARHGVLELVAAISSGCFDTPRVARVRERAKALCFGAGGGGAYGCCFPLKGAVVVPLPVPVFRVKT